MASPRTPVGSKWATHRASVGHQGTSCSLTRQSFKKGFGFKVGQHQNTRNAVVSIKSGSLADGVLKVGDGILAVNGKKTRLMTETEVSDLVNKNLHVKFLIFRENTSDNVPREAQNDRNTHVSTKTTPSVASPALPGQAADHFHGEAMETSSDDVITPLRKPSQPTSAARRASRQTPTRTTPSQGTPTRNTPTRKTPTSTRRESTPGAGRTRSSSIKLSDLSIEDLEKELRARSGQARKRQSINKREEERVQARKAQQALEDEVLKELLGSSDRVWTDQEIKEKRKEAKVKAKAKAKAAEEHTAELKRIEMNDKLIAASHDGAWDPAPASPPPTTSGATAIAAAKAMIRSTPKATTPTRTTPAGRKRSGYGGTVAKARVTPTQDTSSARTGMINAWAAESKGAPDTIRTPTAVATPPQRISEAAADAPVDIALPDNAPAADAPVPNNDGLIYVDVPLNGRKLGFTIAGDTLGRSLIKIIKPGSVLETDSPAQPGDVIHTVHGQDVARADHDDVVRALRACTSVNRIVMTLMRHPRGTPMSPPKPAPDSSSAPATPATTQSALPSVLTAPREARTVVMHKTPQPLKNGDDGFGFTVVAYQDAIYIFKLEGEQRYATAEKLQLGDQVLALNGTATAGQSYEDVLLHLQTAQSPLTLTVRNNPEGMPPPAAATTRETPVAPTDATFAPDTAPTGEQLTTVLTRRAPTDSFGFGFGMLPSGTKVVTQVTRGGSADGHLADGDIITAVNHTDVTALPQDAMIALFADQLTVELAVERTAPRTSGGSVSAPETGSTATATESFVSRRDSVGRPLGASSGPENLSATVTRADTNSTWGFVLDQSTFGAYVSAVQLGGNASVGGLRVGDSITMMNGRNVSELSGTEKARMVTEETSIMFGLRRDRLSAATTDFYARYHPEQDKKNVWAVCVERSSAAESYGFGLGTTAEEHGQHSRVENVRPDGPAAQALKKHDVVLAVGTTDCTAGTSHDTVTQLCVETGTRLFLCVRRLSALRSKKSVRFSTSDAPQTKGTILVPSGRKEHVEIELTRATASDSLGFGLGTSTTGAQVVTHVVPGSIAVGKLEEADLIEQINGVDVYNKDHQEVLRHFAGQTTLRLRVVRAQPAEASPAADGAEVEVLTRTVTRDSLATSFAMGLGLTSTKAHMIVKIGEGSPAENLLAVGDVIISVNGRAVSDIDHDDLVKYILSQTSCKFIVRRAKKNANLDRRLTISTVAPDVSVTNRTSLRSIDVPSGTATTTHDITLERLTMQSSYGFGVGTATSGDTIVTSITETGPAHNILAVGDVIKTIDGHPPSSDHAAMVQQLIKGTAVALTIERVGAATPSFDARKSISKVRPEQAMYTRQDNVGEAVPVGTPNRVQLAFTIERAASGSFGFGLGTTDIGAEVVTSVSEGGAAAGKLQLMDKLEQANGVNVAALSHEETIEVIKKAHVLHLVVSRADTPVHDSSAKGTQADTSSTPRVLQSSTSIGKRVVVPVGVAEAIQVTIARPTMASSFGFGFGTTEEGDQMVTKVSPGGAAAGKLHVGDKLSRVNGALIDKYSHEEVIQLLVAGLSIDLEVQRNVARPSTLDKRATISRAFPKKKIFNRKDSIGRHSNTAPSNKTFELSVTLIRQDHGSSFGFGIGTAFDGSKVVTSVNPGGLAESKIAVSDGIKSINGQFVGDKSHEETVQLITSALQLELVVERPTSSSASTMNPPKSISQRDQRTLVAQGDSLGSSHRAENGAITISVRLSRSSLQESFGFGLGTSTSGEKLVTKIAEDSPAWNKLYAGDAVIQVNGQPTSHLLHDAVVEMITETLDVELQISRMSSTATTPLNRKASISKIAPDTQLLERRDELGRRLVDIPAGVPTQLTTTLNRPTLTTSFGFGLGTTPGGEKVVTSVSPGGLATGKIEVADRVLSVNGQLITSMEHVDAIQLVAGAAQITLVLQRNVQPQGLDRHASISKHSGVTVLGRHDSIGKVTPTTTSVHVVVERASLQDSFGLGVGPTNQGEHLVTMTAAGGCCDGKLATGDKIQSINGTSVQGIAHQDVVQMIKEQTRLELVVQRKTARVQSSHPDAIAEEEETTDVVVAAKTRHEIRLERPSMQTSFGFGMGTTTTGDQIISKVTPGGLAEDKLVVGDVIQSINGISTYHANHDDSVANICSGLACDLTIERRPGSSNIDRRGSISKAHPQQAAKMLLRRDSIGRPTILLPTGTPDELTVVLERATMESSFGFGLGTTTDGEKVVTKVSEGGIAVGKVEVSDVIKRVNGRDIKAMPHPDVVALVCSSTVVELVVHRVAGPGAPSDESAADFDKRASITTVAPTVGDRIMQRRDSIGRRVMQIPAGPIQALEVVLERPTMSSSFGFGIGTTTEGEKIVTKISDGGIAEGKLTVSDAILAVNGISVRDLDHNGVIALICESTTLKLDVHRVALDGGDGGSSTVDPPRKGSITQVAPLRHITKRRDSIGRAVLHVPAGEPRVLSVRLERTHVGESFGFGVGTAESGETLVTNVHDGTEAASLLQVADIIVAINGSPVASRSHADVMALFTDVLTVQLEIRRNIVDAPGDDSNVINPTGKLANITLTRASLTESFGVGITSDDALREHFVSKLVPGSVSDGKLEMGDKILMIAGRKAGLLSHDDLLEVLKSTTALELDAQSTLGKLKRVTVTRASVEDSFGVGITTNDNVLEHRVTQINPTGLSAGKLFPGDEIVSIGGTNAASLTHEDIVVHMKSKLQLELVIRKSANRPLSTHSAVANTADTAKSADTAPAVPATAAEPAFTFHDVVIVRESPTASFGFGIGALASGEHVVSNVASGSPAAGNVQIGDEIVSINGTSIVFSSVKQEEVVRLMKSSGATVKLVVKRREQTQP
eukprot:m.1258860 g.1258860  ORF g.1258860 m.1258860 type:complete len:2861 (-) comp24723_c1_seq1:425-9007(-)